MTNIGFKKLNNLPKQYINTDSEAVSNLGFKDIVILDAGRLYKIDSNYEIELVFPDCYLCYKLSKWEKLKRFIRNLV